MFSHPFSPPRRSRGILAGGEATMAAVKAAVAAGTNVIPRAEATLKAPIRDVEKIICVGMNYVDHCTEQVMFASRYGRTAAFKPLPRDALAEHLSTGPADPPGSRILPVNLNPYPRPIPPPSSPSSHPLLASQNMPVPTEPVIFSKFSNCIINPGDDIVKVPETEELDFEVEMVIVVGKSAHRVLAADAMDYVAGYTVAHDVSARDWQLKRNGGQWLLGKTMNTFCPIGPAIVTPDELGDAHKLGIRCRLNGESVQDSNTDQLVFKTGEVIEWLTQFITLTPGDLILTGTPPGVGCFRKPQLWLKAGDVVECEIDGIGCISNKVVDEVGAPQPKKAKA